MQTHLASYADIIPHSFKTGAYGYLVTLLVPTLLATFFVSVLWITRATLQWALIGFAISLLVIILSLFCMRMLSLKITSEGISYSGPFGHEEFVSYSEISMVVLLDHRLSFWRPFLQWTITITPRADSQKLTLRIPLTLFPQRAYDELVSLFHPVIWVDSDPTGLSSEKILAEDRSGRNKER